MSSTYIQPKSNRKMLRAVFRILAFTYLALLAASLLYLCFFTQNRFVSTASFKVTSPSGGGTDISSLQLTLGGAVDAGGMDSQVVNGFIVSSDLLMELEEKFHLNYHFSAPRRDVVLRLSRTAPLEERLDYYRGKIRCHYDPETGLIMLNVETFDPKLSLTVANHILRKAEDFVNKMNQAVADQQVGFVRKELERAQAELDKANKELTKEQGEFKIISPQDVINLKLAVIQELQKSKLRDELDLTTLERDTPESPRIEIVRSQIRSLNERIDIEMAGVSGPERERLNQILMRFKEIEMKIEFATRMRLAAETLLEKTRVQTIAKSKFFSLIQNPYLPEDIAEPRRWYWAFTITIIGLLVFMGLRALVSSALDRA